MKKLTTIILFSAALGLSVNAASARPGLQPDGLAGPDTQSEVGLLLPAVQAAREAARRPSAIRHRGPHIRVFDGNSANAAPGGLPRRHAYGGPNASSSNLRRR